MLGYDCRFKFRNIKKVSSGDRTSSIIFRSVGHRSAVAVKRFMLSGRPSQTSNNFKTSVRSINKRRKTQGIIIIALLSEMINF